MIRDDLQVVLAYFNGGRYINKQVESIYSQTIRPGSILIYDDNSSKLDRDILLDLAHDYGEWLQLLEGSAERLGCTRAFEKLLAASSGKYVLLSDQDDIWRPDKVARLLKFIDCNSKIYDDKTAFALFSNAHLVNEDGLDSGNTLFRANDIDLDLIKYSDLYIRNFGSGCTLLVSRHLIDVATPFPPNLVMHDWWLMLVAATLGRLAGTQDCLIAYRQHSSNLVGAYRPDLCQVVKRIIGLGDKIGPILNLHRIIEQDIQIACLIGRHNQISWLMQHKRPRRVLTIWRLVASNQFPSKGSVFRDIFTVLILLSLPSRKHADKPALKGVLNLEFLPERLLRIQVF